MIKILSVMLLSAALAQSSLTVTGTTSNILKYNVSSMVIVTISSDGQVRIDWDRVNNVIKNPNSVDISTLAIARALLAARQGTWQQPL